MIGIPFILDGVASEVYDASIVSINNNSVYKQESGSGNEFVTDTNPRSAELLLLGASQFPVLSFEIDVICDDAVDIFKFVTIKDWLFGSNQYRNLQLCIDDFDNFHFECQIQADSDYIFMDGYRGVHCKVVCNSSFAWTSLKTKTYSSVSIHDTNVFDNLSADNNGIMPIVEFKITKGEDFKIVNKSLNNLSFEWSDLQNNEIITCDCKNAIITSSTGLTRVNNFNKTFLKFKKGRNQLEFWGNVDYIKFKYRNAVRLGGGMY